MYSTTHSVWHWVTLTKNGFASAKQPFIEDTNGSTDKDPDDDIILEYPKGLYI
jgi:hypothetical protein